jgi:hypothetical protein
MTNGDVGELHQLDLNLHPNEASGLLNVGSGALLEAHGWEFAFWAVLDEGRVEDCIAVIGHRAGADIAEGWEIERLHARAIGDRDKTEDAEAITAHDGRVYILGSHFGSKDGPLQPKRGFVARFREDEAGHATEDPAMDIEISRRSFALHRIINDALADRGPALVPLGAASHETLIAATIERGEEEGKRWSGLVREGDYPINVEGAAFREDGSLLLGLRFPTAADGRPVMVELEGVDRLFEAGLEEPPRVLGFWVVDAVGREGEMAGVRDLALMGDELHLVTGNIDSRDKDSILLQDYPGGLKTVATHFRTTLPPGAHSGSLAAEFVHEFPALPRVEGIAITRDGRFFYVTDEDEGVHLRLTRLFSE